MILAALLLAAAIGTAAAQEGDTAPPSQKVPVPDDGPISGGIYHQPTQAEIQQREHDSKAYQQHQQQESQEVDQLYNQLIDPGQTPKKP
jgi:hypothetical protein